MQKKTLVVLFVAGRVWFTLFRSIIADIVMARGLFLLFRKHTQTTKNRLTRIETTVKGWWRWLAEVGLIFFENNEHNKEYTE